MILPRREDALHKAQLYRLLTGILDSEIAAEVFFKGGTAAAMLGFLDRFSIDLDFDLKKDAGEKKIDQELKRVFAELNLDIDKKSSKTLFYVLKYQAKPGLRNSIKLSLVPYNFKNNIYKPFYLNDIDRYAVCPTVETMFGNKLVALTDRYKKTKSIVGRDLYDIHHFFINGFGYNSKIVEERTGKKIEEYLKELTDFIEKKVNDRIITEDLNYLLPVDKFRKIKKVLQKETLLFLRDEIKRLSQGR